jgi:hypothetical protein
MISFTSNSFVMLALVGALACGGSAADDSFCRADYLKVKEATASSVESNHFVADWAVDGDPNSRWASDGPGADGAPERQWLKLDLGDIGFIDSINLQWERAYSRDYVIQVSNYTIDDDDDEEWETVANMSDIMDGYLENVELSMLDVKARYVRILSTKGDPTWGISLYEVKIFGDSKGGCIAGPPTCRQTGIVPAEAFASSSEGSHWGPENAIDGDRSTRWSSEFEDDEWLTVDLGEMTLVYSVWLFWERAYAGSYNLEAGHSESGPWTTIFETTESDGDVDIIQDLGEGHGVQTQYLRLLSTSRATRYGNSLWEFEVRGTQDNSCFPTMKPTPTPTSAPTPRPTTSAPTPRPTTSAPTPRPTTSAPTPRPTTSAPTPRPTTSAPTPRPTTSAPTPRPTPEDTASASASYSQTRGN